MLIAEVADKAQERSPVYASTAAWKRKNVNGKKEDEETTIGKAAEVMISKAGRKLAQMAMDPVNKMGQTDFMTPTEMKLAALKKEAVEKTEYKKKAEELQKQIDSDTTLSADDRETMQSEVDDLLEKSKTTDDELNDLYDKRKGLKDHLDQHKDEMLPDEVASWQSKIDQVTDTITYDYLDPIFGKFKTEGNERVALNLQINEERAKLGIEDNLAKAQGGSIDRHSSDLMMSVCTPEQIAATGKKTTGIDLTSKDVIQEAVKNGQEMAEKADDDSMRLVPDKDDASPQEAADKERAIEVGRAASSSVQGAGKNAAVDGTESKAEELAKQIAAREKSDLAKAKADRNEEVTRDREMA